MKAQPFGKEIMVTNAFPLCRNMNARTLKLKKSFKGESLTFVGFYPTDFRPVFLFSLTFTPERQAGVNEEGKQHPSACEPESPG